MGKATRNRLRELGYAEGRDILLQARWANGNMERLDDPVGSGIVPRSAGQSMTRRLPFLVAIGSMVFATSVITGASGNVSR